MKLLNKIRGLYRFDGDTEPVLVNRRTFIFMGGVVAAGAMLPIQPAPHDAVAAIQAAMIEACREFKRGMDSALLESTFYGMPYHHNPNAGTWLGLERGGTV